MKNKLILCAVASFCLRVGTAQSCEEKLDRAQRAYFNGNLEQVINSLSNCITNSQFGREDHEDALKLLINSHLILNEDELADGYMTKLLHHFPLTRIRSTDLVEFKRLYDSYDIRPKANFGFKLGFNSPDFEIMQYRSYASFREEPLNYESVIAPSIGIAGEYVIWNNLFIGGSLLYQNHRLSFNEVLLDLQELKVRESMHLLHIPVVLKYTINIKPVTFFVSGGFNSQIIISSKADLTILELDRDFPPPIFGSSGQIEDYELTFQRNRLNFSYTFGAGLRKQLGQNALEVGVYYDYGLNNLARAEERYSDQLLLTKFSYVPDDFKMNHYRFTLAAYRTIFKSKKK